MAGNPSGEGLGDDFFEQILAVQPPYGGVAGDVVVGSSSSSSSSIPMMGLQLGSGVGVRSSSNNSIMPLGLNLEHHGFLRQHQHQDHHHHHHDNTPPNNLSSSSTSSGGIHQERDTVHMASLFPSFGQLQTQPALRPPPPHLHQPYHSQAAPAVSGISQPPAVRPRVRARRGQATDPHSIAERLRRERIAERMKALQELVPTANKTDRAAMLDEIVDYVKFLRLQVKVLSMSRLGATGAVAQLVADVPLSSIEGESIEGGGANQAAWEKWSNDGTEQQVAKLMEEDVGAAMQFLQSKALCIMPISLASAIFRTDAPSIVKPESNNPS